MPSATSAALHPTFPPPRITTCAVLATSAPPISDSFQIMVQAEDGFGLRNEKLIKEVGHDMFGDIEKIEPGMLFQTANTEGTNDMVTVVAVSDNSVTVDHNHPLAGVALNFAIDVIEVRDATPEEIAHGHIHEPSLPN